MKSVYNLELSKVHGKKINRYGNSLGQNIFIIALLIIPLLNFLVFTVYANFGGIFISFKTFDYSTYKEVWCGFDNYSRFFRDFEMKEYDKSILASLAYFPLTMFISLPFSLLTAYFLYKKIPFSKAIVVVLYLPNIIPAAVLAEFYKRLWDAGGGVVQPGFLNQLFTGGTLNWLATKGYSNYALWIYTVWFGFGFNALLLWGAMTKVPQEIVESSNLDGANKITEFFKVTIPIIWPTLSMVIVLTATIPFQIYMQPLLLANNGDYGTRTIALLAMQELKRPDPYFAAAIQILTACVSIPTILVIKKLTDKVFDTVEV